MHDVLILPVSYPNPYRAQSHNYIRAQAEALANAGSRVGVLAVTPVSFKRIWSTRQWKFGTEVFERASVQTWQRLFPSVPKWRRFNHAMRLWLGKALFRAYLRRHGKPKLIHAHVYLAADLAIWIEQRYGIPYVITEHYTQFARGTLSPWHDGLARRAFAHSRRNLAVSREFCDLLGERYPFDFHYVPNCVDTEFFSPAKDKPSEEPFLWLSVGYLEPKKDHAMLVRAFSHVATQTPNARLIIAGSGPERQRLQTLIETLGLSERITLYGYAPREEVRSLMRRADAFVLSSRYETFGVVLAEAMSCGLPLLSTRSGGPESIIENPALGRLVSHDETELSEAMVAMQQTDYDAAAICDHARRHFSNEAVAHRLQAIYTEVLND